MIFTSQPPTVPGFYAWKQFEEDTPQARTIGPELFGGKARFYGLWCRLVPVDEVEKAYAEGWNGSWSNTSSSGPDKYKAWHNSHARKVVEGGA